jgi:hypothetical protein
VKSLDETGVEYIEEKELSINKNLVMFIKQDSRSDSIIRNSKIFNKIKESDVTYEINIDKRREYKQRFVNLIPQNVTLFTSELALQGKTTKIKELAQSNNSKLLTLNLAGDLNPKNLKARLVKLRNEIKQV